MRLAVARQVLRVSLHEDADKVRESRRGVNVAVLIRVDARLQRAQLFFCGCERGAREFPMALSVRSCVAVRQSS